MLLFDVCRTTTNRSSKLSSIEKNNHDGAGRARGDQHESTQATEPSRTRGARTAAVENRRQSRRRATHAEERSNRDGYDDPGTGTPEALDLFLRRSRAYPLLTATEEIELAKRVERGDMAAKDRMINSNLRLVVSQARRYLGHGLPMEDLVQEGMFGLIRAVEKFDWRRGYKFSTYGTLWIRQSLQRGLQNHGRTIRLPVHVSQRQTKVRKVESQLSTKLSREPTDEEIAAAAELPLDDVIELRELGRGLTSLDQPVGDDGETALGDLLPGDRPQPIEEVAEAEREEQVSELVDRLPEAERNVIRLRFGIGGDQPRSLTQIGTELGISTARARELEDQGLSRLASIPELEALREAA
jgi:RNA polymerase primary sigma factor